jgi:dihydrofolate synthase / folylpolyglutamate synthase
VNSEDPSDTELPIVQNYKEALRYIYNQLPMFHRIGAAAYKNNLDSTIALSNLCGKPELQFPSIHIAGTNGKGSVANMLASILQEAGFKTGLFTSPHLKDFRERILVNGEMISKNEVTTFISKHQTDFEAIRPSFFELTFALAMQHFADKKVDIAVVETGMGGRLDSTNIVRPLLSIITNISYDHMQFLGNTLPEIAIEKAGIIKPKVPVLIGKTQVETQDIFIKTAQNLQSPIIFADKIYKTTDFDFAHVKPYGSVFNMLRNGAPVYKDFYCPLSGYYQRENLQTVFAAYDILNKNGFKINRIGLFDGIGNVTRNTGMKGRWQVMHRNPLIICDTAHNEAGIASALAQIATLHYKKLHFVIGMVNDKDIKKILSFLPLKAIYYFCKPNIPRGLDQKILAKKANKAGLEGITYDSVKEAYRAAQAAANADDLVFVGGSTFVVAEVV